jgi:hypothetical protein
VSSSTPLDIASLRFALTSNVATMLALFSATRGDSCCGCGDLPSDGRVVGASNH